MSRTEAPGTAGGARTRQAGAKPEPEGAEPGQDASVPPGGAWWAESWTPMQPSPARAPLPWLPADGELPVRIDAHGEEAEPPVLSESHAPRAGAAEPSSNLPVLTITERRARAAALRALLLARQRRFEPAEQAFREAAELDPALDLSHVATFWELERGGHEAAIRAYESLGRVQDAKWLRARIETRYRPRLVRSA